MHALILHALLLSLPTQASAPVQQSGVERGWDSGTQVGAVGGALVGIVVIPGALVFAIDMDDIKNNRADLTSLVVGDVFLTAVGAEVFAACGAFVGALAGGAIGAASGAAGLIEPGDDDDNPFAEVQLALSGSARLRPAVRPAALPVPAPLLLAADPVDDPVAEAR